MPLDALEASAAAPPMTAARLPSRYWRLAIDQSTCSADNIARLYELQVTPPLQSQPPLPLQLLTATVLAAALSRPPRSQLLRLFSSWPMS